MVLFRGNLPPDRRCQRLLAPAGDVLKKRAKQLKMLGDLRHIGGAKIIVRHELKVCLNLLRIIGGEIFGYQTLQALALNLRLFVIRFLISEIA